MLRKSGIHGAEVGRQVELLEDSDMEHYGLEKPNEKIIGFHPGCKKSETFKRWPLEHWERLIILIGKKFPDYRLMMFCGPDESEESEYFKRRSNVEIRASLSVDVQRQLHRCMHVHARNLSRARVRDRRIDRFTLIRIA
jgi:ADP-heptose:LPS heptosyltransferase